MGRSKKVDVPGFRVLFDNLESNDAFVIADDVVNASRIVKRNLSRLVPYVVIPCMVPSWAKKRADRFFE
jgi:hypothetical protein